MKNEELTLNNSSDLEDVKIGQQIWAIKNLDVSTFRNGDIIPEAKTDKEWEKAGKEKKPACCYYDNDPANGNTYGKLYNWFAVSDPRVLAPNGWLVPNENEWTILFNFLGGGGKSLLKKIKSKKGWEVSEMNGKMVNNNGSNKSGFNALPGGERYDSGEFLYKGGVGSWWNLGNDEGKFAWRTSIWSSSAFVNSCIKSMGFSVRCIKDFR